MVDFGNRLKDLRMKYGLTQEEVADKICVTKQAVSKWENGLSLPDVATLGSLAELYNTTVDYLLTGEEKVRVEKEVEVVEKIETVEVEKPLSEEEKERLQDRYVQFEYGYYGLLFVSIIFAFILVILAAFRSYGAIGVAFGLCVTLIGSLYARKNYKEEKELIKKLENKLTADKDSKSEEAETNTQNDNQTEEQD